MRVRTILLVAVLSSASIGVAQAQQATPTSKGIGFVFDAPSGQLTASGLTLKPVQAAAGTAANYTGTVDVTINVNLISKFPAGTTFPCSAIAIGGQLDTTTATVNGGIETATSTAHRSMGVLSCTVTIPFEWTLVSGTGDNGLIVAFAVGAVQTTGNGENAQKTTLRSTIQLSGIETLPASGTTSTFTFNAAL